MKPDSSTTESGQTAASPRELVAEVLREESSALDCLRAAIEAGGPAAEAWDNAIELVDG